MHLPNVNYGAVLAAGIAVFILGGLWYSPLLFARRWVLLLGKTEEELKAGGKVPALMFLQAFLCGLLVAWVMAIVVSHFADVTLLRAVLIAFTCWLGFAGATSYANVVFAQKPLQLWLIDSGYNLVSFILAVVVIVIWPW
jgi:hypothetical protein